MDLSSFAGYSIANQLFNTVQVQMDVAGNNISNASNPAYSQQAAVVQPAPPLADVSGVGEVGGGSEVASIQRQRDTYVDAQRVATQGQLGESSTLAQGLNQLQGVLNESNGQGISNTLNQLTSAFASLAAQPSDPSLRAGVVDAASTAAGAINQEYSSLASLRQQADQQASQAVGQMNSTAQSVAALNVQIANAQAAGQQPNDLMDQRQADLETLGTLAGADSTTMANGMVSVNVNGHWLVDQGTSASVSTAQDPLNPAVSSFTWADNGQAFSPAGGEAQGALTLRDQDVAGAMGNLNTLAASLVADYNGLQSTGYALGAATPGGSAFFTGTGASTIAVDPALAANPSALAAAQNPSAPGDGTNATAFAALADKASAGLGTTYTGALSTWTSEVGASAALATQQQTTQQSSMTQLNNLTSSVSGVDLNEQAISLSEYQQAYEAGAHYVGTLDQMMQSLISEITG